MTGMATIHVLSPLAEMPAWLGGLLKALLVLGAVVCAYLVAYVGIYAHRHKRKREEDGKNPGG